MALTNTFIYQAGAPDASKQFADLVAKNYILFIVYGKDPISQKVVNEADRQAATVLFGIKRQVIWLPNHDAEKDKCLQMLKGLAGFDATLFPTLLAFSVKPLSDIAADTIFPKEIPDDINLLLRVKRAFYKAGITPQAPPPPQPPSK